MTGIPFPPPADVPDSHRTRGRGVVRYEDVSQDGFLKVCGMPHVLGSMFFRTFWVEHPIGREFKPRGVVPILSRLTLASVQGPLSVRNLLEGSGSYSLGTLRDEAGEVRRLMLNVDAELRAPKARTHGPPPRDAGEMILVGRVHAEHVFTRPFGPPGQRRVTDLSIDGQSMVPDEPVVSATPEQVLELPEGARWLEPEFARDPMLHCFGLVHTDSNQHINSLVYPMMFEEALVRLQAERGEDFSRSMVQHIDLAFRKPCFAGDRVEVWLRTFELGARRGAVAYLAPKGTPPERAHVTCCMLLH